MFRISLRTLYSFVFFALLIGAVPAQAGAEVETGSASLEQLVMHGGGCRKDSPPGKCCHAGSQPYHCH